MSEITFVVIAVASISCALMVVLARELLVAAISLMGLLAVTAGIYVLLGADFLAGMQILVYVAGTVVLIIFAVMLTQSGAAETKVRPFLRRKVFAFVVSAAFLGVTCGALGSGQLVSTEAGRPTDTVRPIAHLLLSPDAGGYVLPLELVSLLLLVVLIGGIVLARPASEPVKHPATTPAPVESGAIS